jgi:hypothetical protein
MATGGLLGLLAFAAARPLAAPAQALDESPRQGWTDPGRPDMQRSARPKPDPVPEQAAPDPSAGLRITPADAVRVERELSAIRERLLALRAERSRLTEELRQLGGVHGNLDEALSGTTSGFRAGRIQQQVEERERELGSRQSTLEEEERTLSRSRAHLETLLRELQRVPQGFLPAIS